MFKPKSVAVIGASNREGSVGRIIVHNLLSAGFEGIIMPVNPKYQSVCGILSYKTIAEMPVVPDLAVVVTPAETVPGVLSELGMRGTKAAVVISAGFSEVHTKAGNNLEEQLIETARKYGMRIIGPNCVGVMAPGANLNASFAHISPRRGNLAFISQSGAMCTTVLDWADAREIGFSHFISIGDAADLGFGDLIEYLGQDKETDAILLYVEAIKNARKFMRAARKVAAIKPIIAIKAGKYAEGMKAAASHTGALAGSYDIYTAAFRRAGMLRVNDVEELFESVETLARAKPIKHTLNGGGGLLILTNGGGPGVLATDALMDAGGKLAPLPSDIITRLDSVLPPTWSRANPVDIIGDAGAERYKKALEILLAEDFYDALLVMNCPTAIASGIDAARAVIEAVRSNDTPVFVNWLGEDAAAQARKEFAEAKIPSYKTPGGAVRGFMDIYRFHKNQAALQQNKDFKPEHFTHDKDAARKIISVAMDQGREMLTEMEAKAVLTAFGIPIVPTKTAQRVEEAVLVADELGYPVALKILSHDITHKSDVGGVILNLVNARAVTEAATAMLERVKKMRPDARIEGFTVQKMARWRSAHELIIGVTSDPQFGPVIMFGEGGTAVEVVDDKCFGLPPLNKYLAKDIVSRTRIYKKLLGYRDQPPANLEGVYDVMVRVSELLVDLDEIVEMDINPLLADDKNVLALDARIRVCSPTVCGFDKLAIKPERD